MPRPSNASLHVPSERVFQSPLDFPNALVCILDDAVSKGCTTKTDIRFASYQNSNSYQKPQQEQENINIPWHDRGRIQYYLEQSKEGTVHSLTPSLTTVNIT